MRRLLYTLFLLLPVGSQAANHERIVAPLTETYPVACSNIAQDGNAIDQIGGAPADFWEGIPLDGQLRYIAQILAEPQAAIQFSLQVPDDRELYVHFAGDTLPFVVLVCYPTSPYNPRADYVLPDSQVIPRMERSGDLPIFPDARAKFPLIVYSHGIGNSPVSGNYLGTIERMAGSGYIVMAVFHGDGRIAPITLDHLSDVIYLLRNFDRYVELQALRPLALKAALDDLLARPGYREQIDTQAIGGFGVSLGGEAMLLSLGAELTSNTHLSSRAVTQDPRIKAAVGYVPYSGQRLLPAFGDNQNGARHVTRPFLAIGGTADTTAPLYMTEQAVNHFAGSRYLVALTDVQHRYYPEYADDVFSWAITFLDAHVKDERVALARLVQMGSVADGLEDNLRIDYTAPLPAAAGEIMLTEFSNSRSGHFVTGVGQAEEDFINAFAAQGWIETGMGFKAWAPGSAAAKFAAPVCRFYRGNGQPLLAGGDTLFYTVIPEICNLGKTMVNEWAFFGTPVNLIRAGASGSCPFGTIAINRAYNNGAGENNVNHRFATSNSEMKGLEGEGWTLEGVEMCAPL
jgi:hypothetical protein